MDLATLTRAIVATFERRAASIPEAMPLGLSAEFARDPGKRQQWDAFLGIGQAPSVALESVKISMERASSGTS